MTDATEVVAEAAEAVAEEAIEVAEVARGLNPREVKFLLGGIGIGLLCGAFTGYKIAERRLNEKYRVLAEEEISEMREHYVAKVKASQEKPSLEDMAAEAKDIVEHEGYAGPNVPTEKEMQGESPLAVSQEEPDAEAPERLAGSVPGNTAEETVVVEETVNVFESTAEEIETEHDASEGWDYEEEIRLRRPDRPYVIHYDEKQEKPYVEADFTYYEGDDVLANELDEVIDPAKRDDIIGEANLQKFGHGSPDLDAVIIRNDVLQLEITIAKHEGKYAEVVHGFIQHQNDFLSGRRRGKPKFDDDGD